MKSCSIPKDYYTGKTKGYAFIIFYAERDAKFAQESCSERLFMDKLLSVSFAYEKKNSRSRSRSPSQSSKLDSEFQTEIESLLKNKEELIKKNTEIRSENEKLKKELWEYAELKKSLKDELTAYKTQKVIFLPCGHSKLVSLQEYAFYEEILAQATLSLSAKESENFIILRQLRYKILDILNTKFADHFKCREKVNFLLGKCGHTFATECNLVPAFKKGERFVECRKSMEKLLACGHSQIIECWKEFEVVLCKNC